MSSAPRCRVVVTLGLVVLPWLWPSLVHAQPSQKPLPVKSYVADPGAGARERVIDQQRMTVWLSFEPEQGRVHGTVTHVFAPLRPSLDSLYLDGPEIDYQEVLLNGQPVAHAVWPGGISIYPAHPLVWQQVDSLQITYTAEPRRGLYFVGWNEPEGVSRRQIWSQGQGPGNQYWVPLYDTPSDKLVTEMFVTFDDDYEVLSNGERMEIIENEDGTRTWHYRMTAPHASYLMMLGIGRYGVQETTSTRGVPIRNYYYPDQPDRVAPTYGASARMMDLLEAETGVPYPWPSYAQLPVNDFLHGGMENTTATILSDFYYVDARAALDKSSTTVLAHEMAHQWFGDDVTMAANEDVWLHESFATHYAKRVERALFGEDHYEWNRKIERDQALSDSTTGPIPIHHTRAGILVYYKGSLVLDMLRDVIGDESFDYVIQQYLTEHAYANVTTADFYQAFEEVLGLDLDWCFDEWIEHGGEPHYHVAYRASEEAGGGAYTDVTIDQIQPTSPLLGTFRMPIRVEVHYTDGTKSSEREWVEGLGTSVRVANPGAKAIDFVLFDPQDRVLKTLTFERSVEELTAQALRAPHMIDRYDAVVALAEVPVAEKRAALAEVFAREPFGEVRAEVIQQLAADPESVSTIAAGLADPEAVVRGAVLENVPTIPESLVDGFEQALADSSYRNVATALTRLAAERPNDREAYLHRTSDVVGHDHNVRLAWLEVAVRAGHSDAIDDLVEYAAPSQGFRTRLQSFAALDRLGYFDDRVAAYLLDAAMYFNRHLNGPATAEIQSLLADETSYRVLQAAYEAGPWTERQAQAMRPWFEP